jgi:hypothetical protein
MKLLIHYPFKNFPKYNTNYSVGKKFFTSLFQNVLFYGKYMLILTESPQNFLIVHLLVLVNIISLFHFLFVQWIQSKEVIICCFKL